jgi:Putative rhamnosyl transferase
MTEQPEVAAPVNRLAEAPLLVVTRFAFLGISGWKSDASRDAELLFEPDRLRVRLELFRSIALPSLAAQTDRKFRHMVLTSAQLPDWALAELKAACDAAYGDPERYAILAEPKGQARRALRIYMERAYSDPLVAQMVLDDDDGLACDFVAAVRRQLVAMDESGKPRAPDQPTYVSHADGYGLVLNLTEDGETEARLFRHRYPFINLGLTLVGRRFDKNILGISHRKDPPNAGARSITGKPMFIRSLHGTNDSRVAPTARWKPVDAWRESPDIRARFPWLLDSGAFWNIG